MNAPTAGIEVLSAEIYDLWAIDYLRKEVVVVMRDGTRLCDPLPADEVPPRNQIAASIFHWDKWWISIVTDRLDTVFLMGFNPHSVDPSPNLPTVYLDQNMWSTVATYMTSPGKVTNRDERNAAEELIRLATDAGIVLPLSCAHLLETSGLHTERRYELGLAIAQLSTGWQMRHPMDVWETEAASALAVHEEVGHSMVNQAQTVLTTEPGAWKRADEFGFGEPFSADVEGFLEMLSAPAVLVSTLIDPTPTERTDDPRWVRNHQQISRQIGRLPKPSRQRTARRRYWNENLGIYRRAAAFLGSAAMPGFSDRELRRFLRLEPMTSLLSELFVQRFIDDRRRWQRNDLVDMLYLSCAAGYADWVAAENHTATQLRQIQRSQEKPETVFNRLSDLVTALRDSGVTTEQERLADSE